MDLAINIVMAGEAIAAVIILAFVVFEIRFLDSVGAYLPDRSLPLYEILVQRAKIMLAIGVYLIVLTMLGAVIGPLTAYLPFLRPLNGLLFLWMLAGPIFIGRALRDRTFTDLPKGGEGPREE